EAGLHQADAHRTVLRAAAPVLVAGPQHLDRPALDGVGNEDRLLALRTVAVAAVAAALKRRMDIHVFAADARQHGRIAEKPLRILVAAPDVDAPLADEYRRIPGLHARTWRVRHGIGRFDDVRRPAARRLDVAFRGDDPR